MFKKYSFKRIRFSHPRGPTRGNSILKGQIDQIKGTLWLNARSSCHRLASPCKIESWKEHVLICCKQIHRNHSMLLSCFHSFIIFIFSVMSVWNSPVSDRRRHTMAIPSPFRRCSALVDSERRCKSIQKAADNCTEEQKSNLWKRISSPSRSSGADWFSLTLWFIQDKGIIWGKY